MAKSKKRARDNDNEYKTANARFKNPFQQTVDYTKMSASADDPMITTSRETRTVEYNPPSRPNTTETCPTPNVQKEPVTDTSAGRKKTQVSCFFIDIILLLRMAAVVYPPRTIWTTLRRNRRRAPCRGI